MGKFSVLMLILFFILGLGYGQVTTTAPSEAVDWLKTQAKPLKTVQAESGLEDLSDFGTMVGNAKIIGLGEATHGTREFFLTKHRLLEYLVKEKGFTTFAIEATLPESYAVNDYVLNGEGDAQTVLRNLYFWTWNTQEVLDMIEWMRQYNKNPAHTNKIKFFGFDMQSPVNAIAYVSRYVQQFAAQNLAQVETQLRCFRLRAGDYWQFYQRSASDKAECQKQYQAVNDWLLENRQDLVKKSSQLEFERALRHLVVVQQGLQMFGTNVINDALNIRDQAMADNVRWLLENETGNQKIVLWAHNLHVGFDQSFGVEWMGRHLKKQFAENYLSVGFSFARGFFTALDNDAGGILRPVNIQSVKDTEGLEAFLTTVPLPHYYLDLRNPTPETRNWLNQNRPMHSIGAVVSLRQNSHLLRLNILEAHDILIHFDQTTASVLLR
jgi:erythromycin esterase